MKLALSLLAVVPLLGAVELAHAQGRASSPRSESNRTDTRSDTNRVETRSDPFPPGARSESFPAETRGRIAAEVLFEQARQEMEAGHYAAACRRLEASQELDPAIGTLLYLGSCYVSEGRVASAWSCFRQAAAAAQKAGQPDRAEVARAQADALFPKLVRLKLTPSSALPEHSTIVLDGSPVSEVLLGVSLPVDPGRHQIEVHAPGREIWRRAFDTPREGQTLTLEVGVGAPVPPPQPPSHPPAPPVDPRQTWTWVSGGVAALGLAGGGLLLASGRDDTLGTVATSVGASALVTTALLLLVPSPSERPPTGRALQVGASFGDRSGFIGVDGRF